MCEDVPGHAKVPTKVSYNALHVYLLLYYPASHFLTADTGFHLQLLFLFFQAPRIERFEAVEGEDTNS